MPEKLDRCVADVKKDSNVDNAWAVCNASLKEGGPGSGRKKGGGVSKDAEKLLGFKPRTPRDPNDTGYAGKGHWDKGSPDYSDPPGTEHAPEDKGWKATPGSGKSGFMKQRKEEADRRLRAGGMRATEVIHTDETFEKMLEANKKPYPPFDTVQPGEKEMLDPYDSSKEAVAIGGGLSAQGVGGKKHKLEEIEPCPCFDNVLKALGKKT